LQRYFLHQNADLNQRFFITQSDDIHHISKVMRHQIGDEIIVTFNEQVAYQCEIINIDNEGIDN
jgi:16S rRNA (uracil1498-N3)-methyltransferase